MKLWWYCTYVYVPPFLWRSTCKSSGRDGPPDQETFPIVRLSPPSLAVWQCAVSPFTVSCTASDVQTAIIARRLGCTCRCIHVPVPVLVEFYSRFGSRCGSTAIDRPREALSLFEPSRISGDVIGDVKHLPDQKLETFWSRDATLMCVGWKGP